jgi:hypothetical protein
MKSFAKESKIIVLEYVFGRLVTVNVRSSLKTMSKSIMVAHTCNATNIGGLRRRITVPGKNERPY